MELVCDETLEDRGCICRKMLISGRARYSRKKKNIFLLKGGRTLRRNGKEKTISTVFIRLHWTELDTTCNQRIAEPRCSSRNAPDVVMTRATVLSGRTSASRSSTRSLPSRNVNHEDSCCGALESMEWPPCAAGARIVRM